MRSGEDTVEDSGVSEAERTRISSAKLLSSPSRALTASKSNTNWRQQAQCYWGRCAFHGQAREGVAAHLRERGLCSLVWCFQRGEDPACGQDKQDGQQTGAPGCERKRRTWRAHSGAGVRDLPFGGLPKFGWTSASGYTQFHPRGYLSHHLATISMAAVYTDAAHIADGVIGLQQRSLAASGPTE